MRIFIKPDVNAFYCSYYIEGLRELFGERSISYSAGGFPGSRQLHSMLMRAEPDGPRVIIDTRDTSAVYDEALDWCDVYAKVNPAIEGYPEDETGKVLPIGPSFALRIWDLARAALLAVSNCMRSRRLLRGYGDYREHFADYWRQYHYRLPLEEYAPSASSDGYVFFLSSFWRDDPACNESRAAFIESCMSDSTIEFEGGFAPRPPGVLGKYEPLAAGRRYPLEEYIEKTVRSAVTFNTPAVDGCLGWKLAEYLALGKAVISTPIQRKMPARLISGTHIHFVDGSRESLAAALELLVQNRDYRENLERNARAYFLEHLAPRRCIERIMAAL